MPVKEEAFKDDPTVPAETIISNSRQKAIGAILYGMALVAVAIYWFLEVNKLLACMPLMGSVIAFVIGVINFRDREPKIIINEEGMEVGAAAFHSWDNITNEDFTFTMRTNYWETRFSYTCPEGCVDINITELDISRRRMKKLLYIYRGRFDKQL
jgi:hypothetical protein